MLVDTHCHIQSVGAAKGEAVTKELWGRQPDLTAKQILEQAAAADVKQLICVGCDLLDSQLAVSFVAHRPNCWASVGIHPHEAKHYVDQPERLQQFAALANQPKVVAVGEAGLDYFYNHSPKQAQIKVLRFQMKLAQQHNLPMIFHVREAFADFWPIFDQFPGLTGVVHSFTANQKVLDEALQRGLYIGLNGITTFAKDSAQLAVFKAVPKERLLIETDAPFLTPVPFRGRINEPKYARVTAEFLASLRGESLRTLEDYTTANAHRLFSLA